SDIAAVLASLDVSVLPSESESLSNVVMESMAAGVPVVASEVGGNPELLNDGRGMLIPPGDVIGLSEAVCALLQDGNRRWSMGENCRHFARKHFTLERMRSDYEVLYARLLAQKS